MTLVEQLQRQDRQALIIRQLEHEFGALPVRARGRLKAGAVEELDR